MNKSKKEFDLLVFIGRFQPYHNGHHFVVQEAMKRAENVLILVGSANKLPDARNPFTYEQRVHMIVSSFMGKDQDYQLHFRPLNDYPYDENKWIHEVQSCIKDGVEIYGATRIGLIGHAKDHSSYYLKMFPQYESVDAYGVSVDTKGTLLDATHVRDLFFSGLEDWRSLVPYGTKSFLDKEYLMGDYIQIAEEIDFLKKYKKEWGEGPFVTVDAVVVQAGHVLLIRRGDFPGKGQLALPGGFVEPRERLEDAVVRELREETTIDVPPSVLKNRITASQHFANPWRSNRAHIITFAYLFDLDAEIDRVASSVDIYNGKSNLPLGMTKVKGGDDAADANWYPLSMLDELPIYEDHWHILQTMLDKKSINKL